MACTRPSLPSPGSAPRSVRSPTAPRCRSSSPTTWIGDYRASVEATAYFVAAEALTNAIKHAGASRIDLRTWLADDHLHLDVRDDGRGGAMAADGTGLTGIQDRVAALGGTVRVESRDGQGTRLEVALPCASP